jgi:hypothetical protein
VAEQIEGIENAGGDDIGGYQGFHSTAFELHQSNAQGGSLEHGAIVAAIADGNYLFRIQIDNKGPLRFGLIFRGGNGQVEGEPRESSFS